MQQLDERAASTRRLSLGLRAGPLRPAGLAGAAAGLVLALYLGWPWLVALGIAPLLLAFGPCAAMCALGLCMRKGRAVDGQAPLARSAPQGAYVQ